MNTFKKTFWGIYSHKVVCQSTRGEVPSPLPLLQVHSHGRIDGIETLLILASKPLFSKFSIFHRWVSITVYRCCYCFNMLALPDLCSCMQCFWNGLFFFRWLLIATVIFILQRATIFLSSQEKVGPQSRPHEAHIKYPHYRNRPAAIADE